jgi:hypothetical protein
MLLALALALLLDGTAHAAPLATIENKTVTPRDVSAVT